MTTETPVRTSKVCTLRLDIVGLQLSVRVPGDTDEGGIVDVIDEHCLLDLPALERALLRAGIQVDSVDLEMDGDSDCSIESVEPVED